VIVWLPVVLPMKEPATPVPIRAMLARPRAIRTATIRNLILPLVSLRVRVEAPLLLDYKAALQFSRDRP
jgi:hypothetical protein